MVLISILSQSGPFGCCAYAGPVTRTATPASAANVIRFMLLPPLLAEPHPALTAIGSGCGAGRTVPHLKLLRNGICRTCDRGGWVGERLQHTMERKPPRTCPGWTRPATAGSQRPQ